MTAQIASRIGFVPVDIRSSLAFPEPKLLRSTRNRPLSDRAIQACPAVNTFERRTIEILAPFSLGLRCIANMRGGFDLHLIEEYTRIDSDLIAQFVTLMAKDIWRSEQRPVIQIALPHFFVADDVCFLTQMPAWASQGAVEYPGQFVGGRFPTHIWPRALNLAFEWQDLEKPFRMRRGQPATYLLVETDTPDRSIELVRGSMTAELSEYKARIEDVVKYTSGSFSLFKDAEMYRPKILLKEIVS